MLWCQAVKTETINDVTVGTLFQRPYPAFAQDAKTENRTVRTGKETLKINGQDAIAVEPVGVCSETADISVLLQDAINLGETMCQRLVTAAKDATKGSAGAWSTVQANRGLLYLLDAAGESFTLQLRRELLAGEDPAVVAKNRMLAQIKRDHKARTGKDCSDALAEKKYAALTAEDE